MKKDSDSLLNQPSPPPSAEAMETAWHIAVCEFHRSNRKRHSISPARWLWPLVAVATIAILCGILITQPTITAPGKTITASTHHLDLAQLYKQGHQLFGDQLKAVTVSKNRVIWHLSEEQNLISVSDQLVTLTLNNKHAPNLYIATSPGTPVDVPYAGKTHQIEFLSNASDKIIAVGNGIYWDTGLPGSPITNPYLHNISR